MSHLKDQRGFSLIAAVVMMIIFALLSVTVASLVSTDSDISFYELRSTETFYIARAGIERALYEYGNGTICASLSYTNSLGSGSFTATGTLYNPSPSTTLSAGIDNSTTTIPVFSTTGYAPHGRITIDSETIDYVSTTAASFTGARRGAAGTTAASHSGGNLAVDAASSGSGTTSLITVSHTVSGSDRLLIVGVSTDKNTIPAVTSITYGGVNLTLLGTEQFGNKTRMEMWYLVAPATGTANVVVTFASNPSQGGIVGVISFSDVNQTTPLGTFASANGDPSPATVTVSSTPGELVVDTVATKDAAISVGSGQTERWNIRRQNTAGGGSTEAGAATVTMSWSINKEWAIGAVSIKPVNASVSQNQCIIQSTGTVTTAGLGTAQRVVEVGIQ